MDIAFRKASVSEAALVSGILTEAAQWLDASGRALWRVEELTAERILPDVAAGDFHIADVGGEPAGVVKFTLSDPFFWPELPDGGSAFIHRVAVRRAFGGTGVAAAMIQFARERARGLGRTHLRLDCASDRARLRAFYERQGFRHHSDFQAGPWHVSRYEMELAD